MTEPVSIAVVGAGNRGQTYADLAAADGRAQVVAVADPDCARREELADRHAISADRRFDGWEALVGGPRIADMVVVATQDRFHYEPVVTLLDRGYHLLLEKPIATTPEQYDDIVEAAERAGATFAVCHVMRYAPYSLTLQRLLDSGAIGITPLRPPTRTRRRPTRRERLAIRRSSHSNTGGSAAVKEMTTWVRN